MNVQDICKEDKAHFYPNVYKYLGDKYTYWYRTATCGLIKI